MYTQIVRTAPAIIVAFSYITNKGLKIKEQDSDQFELVKDKYIKNKRITNPNSKPFVGVNKKNGKLNRVRTIKHK